MNYIETRLRSKKAEPLRQEEIKRQQEILQLTELKRQQREIRRQKDLERRRQEEMERQQEIQRLNKLKRQQKEIQRLQEIQRQEEIEKEAQPGYNYIVTRVRECPNCKRLFERLAGCSHMVCPGCGLHWNWDSARQGL
ncbi:hypothetical protein BDZ88DRAFT_452186 [Geranomyces variabilis]|nr:hypothetical protein BDZ88DRAFT_452186 [Geranomyces variabilis]KAJ3140565.1 hypothetical protein HDU90_007865 [Geranomyces variabilis]